MKIEPEDMDAVREAINMTIAQPHRYDERDIALALILVRIWDRGYKEGQRDSFLSETYNLGECPYTHSHTREWCGYKNCRES